MKKIIFQDLKALIEVFANSESQRIILGHQTGDQFLWRGPSGFYNKILTVFDFHQKYLRRDYIFDKTVSQISNFLEKIPQNELENQIISIVRHLCTRQKITCPSRATA